MEQKKKKSAPLVFLQIAWPVVAIVLVLQSIVVSWIGKPETVAAWLSLLPLLSGLVSLMGIAAGGGPLVADQIKAKAGGLLPAGESK